MSVNWRFGGTYRLHLQGRKISRARIQGESRWQAEHVLLRWFLARLIFRPWRWWRYVPPKRRLTFNGLHGVISQKIVLFITPLWEPQILQNKNRLLSACVINLCFKMSRWYQASVILTKWLLVQSVPVSHSCKFRWNAFVFFMWN
jgi:hypothetical protein